ncbi:MAG: ATP-binding protein [Pseudomonadota bacterium]|nr:ATP-binding protein [Pseudomonadota bacterium]
MFKIIKDFNQIIILSFLCIFLGIITFLTFIGEGFIELNDKNLQILLIIDIIVLIIFFYLIFKNIYKFYLAGKKNRAGSQTNIKYVSLFSLFTFIPSLLVAVFSLIIFNFGIQNYFDKQITKAVNNSYDVAKNYLIENKENVLSDVILMSVGINRAASIFYNNPERFKRIVVSEKLLRRVDDVYLIDSTGSVIFSDISNPDDQFIIPSDEEFDESLKGNAVFVSRDLKDKTSVMLKLNSLVDTYLLISRNIDPKILTYLRETEQAVNFYYTVENSQTGIKITFAIIYVIVVTLVLFLSIIIAISLARRLTKPIINLISASDNISKGNFNSKVPNIEVDEEFKMLNKNFNNMIERLKKQQDKLLAAERYEAWESVARKLAHEIKNPLTPIQLSIDRLRVKYSSKTKGSESEFDSYLNTITRQIKDIENLVNEFSSFARMPRPVFKKVKLNDIVLNCIKLLKLSLKSEIKINLKKQFFVRGDSDQLNRVFINLIKNSDESISEKALKDKSFKGKINIEIDDNNDYIVFKLTDNGIGISDNKKVMTPYFTTKKSGTGLGLPIVVKILNEHSADFSIKNLENKKGAAVEIAFTKI